MDEGTYDRLKMWKASDRESFSNVIKRVVPAPGTLGALLAYVGEARTSRLSANEVTEEAIGFRPPAKHDPWS